MMKVSLGVGTRLPLLFVVRWAVSPAVAPAVPILRDVVVNGGSAANPIGVGFGVWEGAKPLKISLTATDPDEIGTATMVPPENMIWWPTDKAPPDPWIFETAAILPDKAFAVRFEGTIAGGGTTPAKWVAATSDVDLDCDSLNISWRPWRKPDESDPEDLIEYPAGGSGTGPIGMRLRSDQGDQEPNHGWAELVWRGNIKGPGYVTFRPPI